jgi:hypothetical protein
MSKKQKMQAPAVTDVAAIAAIAPVVQPTVTQVAAVLGVVPTIEGLTLEKVETMTAAQLISGFGNKSNAIRGLSALGMKTGPIAKKLGLIYQHARNVLSKPLKRAIKDERDAAKAVEATPAVVTQEVQSQVAA